VDQLQGRYGGVVVVTGAARGIDLGLAERFMTEGMKGVRAEQIFPHPEWLEQQLRIDTAMAQA
jgi:NAD(P)-dependent dehydrogenase (short-subunit alcohol dehydrogenase family)